MMSSEPKHWVSLRPLLLVLLTTVLIGSAHTAEAQTASEQPVEARKSPWLAFGLSYVIMGSGQAYNGQWAKGGLMLGGGVVSAGVALSCWHETDCAGATVGLIGILGFALWSMIDAPMTAKAINRRIDEGRVGLEVGPQLIVPQSRFAMGGLRPSGFPSSLHRDSRIDLSLVRVRF